MVGLIPFVAFEGMIGVPCLLLTEGSSFCNVFDVGLEPGDCFIKGDEGHGRREKGTVAFEEHGFTVGFIGVVHKGSGHETTEKDGIPGFPAAHARDVMGGSKDVAFHTRRTGGMRT